MIRGQKVVLTALDPRNAETVRGWVNDPEVNRYMLSGHIPLTAAAEESFYTRMEAAADAHVFEIHMAEDMRLIGHVGIEQIDWIHRTGSLGICIGDLANQNRGLGTDAIVTMLRFAFDTVGLNRVNLFCREDNARGLRVYRGVGFTDIGRERESIFAEGRFFDAYMFDMLAREFRARYGPGDST